MELLKTFFYSLKKSLIDLEYHQDIAKASFWFSMKYLWFLLFIFVFIRGIFLGSDYLKNRPFIQPAINRGITYAEKLYPPGLELKIKNGQLSTNVKEPYIYDLDHKLKVKDDRHLLVIDTKGSIENYPDYNTYVLATKNAIIYPSKANGNEIEQTSVFFFSNLKQDFTLNQKIFKNFLDNIRPYTFNALYFIDWLALVGISMFMFFGSFFWLIGIMLGLLVMTFFVWLVNLIFKKGHSYMTLYRIGMHAVTWPIIITEVTKYLGIVIPGVYPIAFLIYFFIILFS